MRNYIATDQLNPNAINSRYGRPASLCGCDDIAWRFSASNDAEAIAVFYELIDTGIVGYSEFNRNRTGAALWRSKDWFNGRKNPIVG